MSEWKEYKFSELLEDESISYGIVQPGTHTDKNSVPIIRVNNIKNGVILTDDVLKVSKEIEKKYLRTRLIGGELLITVVGSVGDCAIVPDDLKGWNVARAVSVARIKNSFNKQFIKYCFQSEDVKYQLYGNTNDTVQPTLNLGSLKEIKFSLPPLPEQTAIASVLSSLDDKIDLLHRQNKTLEQLAETIFRQWFVEEAEESWEEKELENYIWFDPKEKIERSKQYRFFEMKCLSNVDMNISEGIGRVVSSGSCFRIFDTLLAKITPCLENGKTGFVIHLRENEIARGSTEFIVMRSKGIVSPYWVYCLARDNDFRDKAILSMTGTSGRQRVQIDLLKSIKVKVEESRMNEFHKTVFPLFTKIKSNQIQIKTLTQLRDSLLPKLMSGEVRVRMD